VGGKPGNGVASILVIRWPSRLVLVAVSGVAAYWWIDQTHPGPVVATSGPNAQSSGANGPSVSPGGSGDCRAPRPGAGTSASVRPSAAPVASQGTWARDRPAAAGQMGGSASCVLLDGRVLVVGGSTGDSVRRQRDRRRLRPSDQPLERRVPNASGPRLSDGGDADRWLGARCRRLAKGQPLDTAERYNPVTDTWVAAGRLNLPRTQGALTLLGDGRVLMTGGGIEGAPGYVATASAEIFDPATGIWSMTAPMAMARARQTRHAACGRRGPRRRWGYQVFTVWPVR